MTRANEDLPDRLAALIKSTSNGWVMEQQPADWQHRRGRHSGNTIRSPAPTCSGTGVRGP